MCLFLSFKGRGSCPKTPIPRLKQLAIWRVWGSVEAKPGSILSNLADLFGKQGKHIEVEKILKFR